ncbi:MAG: SPOR domain-containing protein [Cycloclasticus sp.]
MDIQGEKKAHSTIFFVPERQQRLDLILHLIPNTRQAILLRGPEQSGKSFFIQQFYTQAGSRWRICSISSDKLMAAKEPLPVFADALDEGDSQKQIFSRLEAWDKANKKIIFCIEDAHRLDAERFEFLFQLAGNYSCVHLLLTSSENLGEELESRCQLIDIEPLTQKQTVDYARARLNKQGLAGIDELVLFIETGGLPGLINNVLAQAQRPAVVDQNNQKVLNTIEPKWLLLGGAVVLTIGALFYVYEGVEYPLNQAVGVTLVDKPQQLHVTPLGVEKIIAKLPEEPLEVVSKPQPVERLIEQKAMAPVEPVPKLQTQTLFAKPIKPQPLPTKSPAESTNKSSLSPKGVNEEKDREVVAEVVLEPSKPMIAKPSRQTQLQKNHHWVQQRDMKHYTLQLLGVSLEESAAEYIVARPELKELLFFRNKRNAGAWFSVIYGDFSSLAEAEKVAGKLPKSLTGLQPWVRTYEAIQAEVFVKK